MDSRLALGGSGLCPDRDHRGATMPYPTSTPELRARWDGIIREDRKILAYRRLLAELEAAGRMPEGFRVEAEGER